LLLLRGYNTLSECGKAKFDQVLAHDDPTQGIGAAWGIKEQLRLTLMATTLPQARAPRPRWTSTWPGPRSPSRTG
jgi:transposase